MKASPYCGANPLSGFDRARKGGQQPGGAVEVLQLDQFVRAVHVAERDAHQAGRHSAVRR